MPSDLTSIDSWNPLPLDYFAHEDVVFLAKDLIGKLLVTTFDNTVTAGRIVETEAYNGVIDRASHAYNNRRTARTEIMYSPAGTAYVYLCYGMHHLFNIVTNRQGIPHAILIRALEPVAGVDKMLERTGKPHLDSSLTRGPGNVSKALGITTAHTGLDLWQHEIWLATDGFAIDDAQIIATPRIGVDYAGADALLPYRFMVKGNKYVSGKR